MGVSCTNFCGESPDKILEEVSVNFTHWELFSEVDHAIQNLSDDFFDRVEEKKLSMSLHTSIANTDIGALNPIMLDATIKEFTSEMECAAKRGIDTITIHPGLRSLSVDGVKERNIQTAKQSCKTLNKIAKKLGIPHVCIENMSNVPIMLGITAEELFEIVDGTDLEVTFDIGHANTAGQIENMIDTFKDRIGNIHIHDNNGSRDEHLTVGDGNIDFEKVFSLLTNYSGRYIIESKTLESAEKSQIRMRQMMKN